MTPTRIAFVGTSGAGKTTVGRAVAARLGVPFVECDAIRHKAGWVEASADELRAGIAAAIGDRDGWVIDGTFQRLLGDYVSGPAQLIVWLDLPLPLKLVRASLRSLKRLSTHERLWNGNRETFAGAFLERDSVVRHLVRAHFRDRRQLPRPEHAHKTLRLCTADDVDRWLARF